ncbi:MAG TPA: outer membrane beta-barrel protein, partial [Gemmatimonadales bacterium]|nr:outer membrane beta-barrel protein [Gemmatimonadales bacterium]
DDFAKLGWQGTAAVSFVPENLPVGFQFDGTYSQFSDESDFDVKEQLIYGTGNVVYKFQTSEESRFRPYLIGGVGIYNLKLKGDDVLPGTDDQTKFGINAGAGFDFKAGAAGLFIEGRFHNVFSDPDNTQFIPLTVGIRFGGS